MIREFLASLLYGRLPDPVDWNEKARLDHEAAFMRKRQEQRHPTRWQQEEMKKLVADMNFWRSSACREPYTLEDFFKPEHLLWKNSDSGTAG